MKIPLLCFWSLCQVFTCLKYSVPMSTFTRTMEMAHMRDILILALSHPPEPHVWPNLEAQFTRLINMHCLAFFQLLRYMKVPKMQYLESFFQLIKRQNMHYRFEWLNFASQFGNCEINNEELRRMLNDNLYVITTDYSDIYKITSESFSEHVINTFFKSDLLNMEDLETIAGLIKLSAGQSNPTDFKKFYNFIENLASSTNDILLPRSVLVKFATQILYLLSYKSLYFHEKLFNVVINLVEKCTGNCKDLKVLFSLLKTDTAKAAAEELLFEILEAPSVDEIILGVIISLYVEGIPENLQNSLAIKSREIADKMSDWEWLAFAEMVLKTRPTPMKVDSSGIHSFNQERCELYLGSQDTIYARLQNIPPVNQQNAPIVTLSCLALDQHRNMNLKALPFPGSMSEVSEGSSISIFFLEYLTKSTFYWEIINNEEYLRTIESRISASLKRSSYLIVIPDENGTYSVTLRDLREDELNKFVSMKEFQESSDFKVCICVIGAIGTFQYYLHDRALYNLKPYMLSVNKRVSLFHNLIWKMAFTKSNYLPLLFAK